jgi:glycosyltransferase involved in cell wall biosynthesis
VRIAHVTDCYLPRTGGIELQVRDLADQQRRAGHDVTVFTPTEGDPAVGVRRLTRDELPAVLRGFDAVHAHLSLYSPFAWTGAWTGSELGRPTVITMHSVPPPGPLLWAVGLATGCRRWNVRWTAVSEVAAAPLRRMLPGREIAVLHNGIDPSAWKVPTSRPSRIDELVVVSVMRLAQRKRPVPLVRMLDRVRADLPAELRLRAVLVGDGPQRGAVQRALRSRGMDAWVDLPGRLTRAEIRDLYVRADLYLAPAKMESFGIAALEARCAGVPVVAMACGGVGEFVRDGREGHLVGSDAEMARVAVRLLSCPDELDSLRVHNSGTLPPMTWDRVLDRSLQAYRPRLEKARPGRHALGRTSSAREAITRRARAG